MKIVVTNHDAVDRHHIPEVLDLLTSSTRLPAWFLCCAPYHRCCHGDNVLCSYWRFWLVGTLQVVVWPRRLRRQCKQPNDKWSIVIDGTQDDEKGRGEGPKYACCKLQLMSHKYSYMYMTNCFLQDGHDSKHQQRKPHVTGGCKQRARLIRATY
jgi:hypothetical protein